MITQNAQIIWNEDSDVAFDVTFFGKGGDNSSSAGCTANLLSPSGKWRIKSYDFLQPKDGNKITITHGSSSVEQVNGTNIRFIFTNYSDDFPAQPMAHDGESQSGPPIISGWNTHQGTILISINNPTDPSTWTWAINYSGYKQ